MSRSSPEFGYKAVSVTAAHATTGEIDFRGARGGRFYVPTGSGITSITWYDAPMPRSYGVGSDAEYAGYEDDPTAAVAQTGVAAGKSYDIPAALFASGAIYPVGNTTGTIYVTQKG